MQILWFLFCSSQFVSAAMMDHCRETTWKPANLYKKKRRTIKNKQPNTVGKPPGNQLTSKQEKKKKTENKQADKHLKTNCTLKKKKNKIKMVKPTSRLFDMSELFNRVL